MLPLLESLANLFKQLSSPRRVSISKRDIRRSRNILNIVKIIPPMARVDRLPGRNRSAWKMYKPIRITHGRAKFR